MKINLLDLPVVYINLDDRPDLQVSTESLLDGLGFTNYTRLSAITEGGVRPGCAKSHLAALQMFEPPFLIMEDDCAPVRFLPEIEIPDGADALFLGFNDITPGPNGSLPTVSRQEGVHHSLVEGYDDLYKVNGLCATHAIVYLTKEHVAEIIKAIEVEGIPSGKAHDLFTCRVQGRANVYAVGTPMFYQTDNGWHRTNKDINGNPLEVRRYYE